MGAEEGCRTFFGWWLIDQVQSKTVAESVRKMADMPLTLIDVRPSVRPSVSLLCGRAPDI
jgi:hypothetical protein